MDSTSGVPVARIENSEMITTTAGSSAFRAVISSVQQRSVDADSQDTAAYNERNENEAAGFRLLPGFAVESSDILNQFNVTNQFELQDGLNALQQLYEKECSSLLMNFQEARAQLAAQHFDYSQKLMQGFMERQRQQQLLAAAANVTPIIRATSEKTLAPITQVRPPDLGPAESLSSAFADTRLTGRPRLNTTSNCRPASKATTGSSTAGRLANHGSTSSVSTGESTSSLSRTVSIETKQKLKALLFSKQAERLRQARSHHEIHKPDIPMPLRPQDRNVDQSSRNHDRVGVPADVVAVTNANVVSRDPAYLRKSSSEPDLKMKSSVALRTRIRPSPISPSGRELRARKLENIGNATDTKLAVITKASAPVIPPQQVTRSDTTVARQTIAHSSIIMGYNLPPEPLYTSPSEPSLDRQTITTTAMDYPFMAALAAAAPGLHGLGYFAHVPGVFDTVVPLAQAYSGCPLPIGFMNPALAASAPIIPIQRPTGVHVPLIGNPALRPSYQVSSRTVIHPADSIHALHGQHVQNPRRIADEVEMPTGSDSNLGRVSRNNNGDFYAWRLNPFAVLCQLSGL